jgi:hypothetical protein
MTQLQPIQGVQGVIRFTFRIVNQRAVTVSHIWTLALTTGLKVLVFDPLLLKNRNGNRLRLAAGATAGVSPRAFPIQNMRHPYPRNIPSHQWPTLKGGHRHTTITCRNHRDPLRHGNITLESTTTLPRV